MREFVRLEKFPTTHLPHENRQFESFVRFVIKWFAVTLLPTTLDEFVSVRKVPNQFEVHGFDSLLHERLDTTAISEVHNHKPFDRRNIILLHQQHESGVIINIT